MFLSFIIITFIFIYLLKTNSKIKGEIFERLVLYKLKKELPNNISIYKGIHLKNKRTGYTNEFDLIVLSKKKIIVVELKNWQGDIYPGKNNWKVFFRGKEHKRYSPLKQNDTKVKTLIDSLKIRDKRSVESLIGFATTYKSLNIKNEKVKSGQDIIITIKNSISSGSDRFSEKEFIRMKTILDYLDKNMDSKIRKKHINDIKKFK